MDVFFEEVGQLFTRKDARQWYTGKGAEILREKECSRKAWLEYYDPTRRNILQLAERYWSDKEKMLEIEDALREDSLVRKLGEEYLGYVTFIMKRPTPSPASIRNRIFNFQIPKSDSDERET